MASRKIKNTVITAALETVIGTDAAPTGADNALLVSDMTITPLDAQNIDRNNIKGYFGLDEQLIGPNSVRCSFTVELAGSGTAATPPAWGTLLLGCAMAEAELTVPARVEYTPVSDALKTLTIYYYDAGVLHKLLGAMGNCTISAKVGERPSLKFDFIGLDGGISAASTTGTYTAWKMPVAMKMSNVTDVTLGATYAAGALAAGTVYPSTGLELMLGNAVEFDAMLSSETVDINDRQVTGKTELELTAAQEVTFMGTVKANTTQGLGFVIGTATGYQIILHAPAVQLTNPQKVDRKGKRLVSYDLRLIPVAGNDELRLACI
jgi:Phage tail tube protein